jgi:hypothetical protein
LFTLPRDSKEEFANIIGPKPQRGWSCIGAETTATLNKPGTINMVRVENAGLKDLKVSSRIPSVLGERLTGFVGAF